MQDLNKVTVIIPAFNEEKNIGQVIDKIKCSKNLDEIIVVDNASTDNTAKIASIHNAKVVFCKEQGKGYAMEKGLYEAKNEVIVFLDADVKNYDENVVNSLAEPIIKKEVDFVKSTFNRKEGGKVTELVTKPMLDILYPNIYKFSEPLSGMIASKKSILIKLQFEKDYGVDIGILLDAIEMGLKIKEINIGNIENLSHMCKTTESMKKMSTEIMRAILKKIERNEK